MDVLQKVLGLVIQAIKAFMVALLAIMTASMFFQVASRYLLRMGVNWTEELARFCNVWIIFLGCAVLVYMDAHIKVTILDDVFAGKGFLKIVHFIRDIVQIVYFGVVVYFAILTLPIVQTQRSPNMLLPMSLMYLPIALGAGLSIVYVIWGNLLKKDKPEEGNNG